MSGITARITVSLHGCLFTCQSSAGRVSSDEDAAIEINGSDYSYHQNGLNIAVYDPIPGTVIDTALITPLEK